MAFSPFAPKPAPRPTNPRAELYTAAQIEEQAAIRRELLAGASPSLALSAHRAWAKSGLRYARASREEFKAVFGSAEKEIRDAGF